MSQDYNVSTLKKNLRVALNKAASGEVVTITRFDEVFKILLVSSADKVPDVSRVQEQIDTARVKDKENIQPVGLTDEEVGASMLPTQVNPKSHGPSVTPLKAPPTDRLKELGVRTAHDDD